MSEDGIVFIVTMVLIAILVILFGGEPDLMDALISKMEVSGVK